MHLDPRRDALQDVMKLAKKLKDKSGGDKAKKRAAAAGDDERLKSIAAQFESDPDLREAAARVQVRVFEFFEDFCFRRLNRFVKRDWEKSLHEKKYCDLLALEDWDFSEICLRRDFFWIS